MYNNRHWFTDVFAGAGFGILSTKVAYWMLPTIKNLFNSRDEHLIGLATFYYDGVNFGFAMSCTF